MGNTQAKDQCYNAVRRLIAEPVSPQPHEFWAILWTTPHPLPLNHIDIHNIHSAQPENFTSLLIKLARTVDLVAFPANPQSPPTLEKFNHAMNSVRLLSRLIPFAHQNCPNTFGIQTSSLESEILSKFSAVEKADKPASVQPATNEQIGAGLEPLLDEENSLGAPKEPTQLETSQQSPQREISKPFGQFLIESLVGMLFVPGFTLVPNLPEKEDQSTPPRYSLSNSPDFLHSVSSVFHPSSNGPRTEILQCLIACLSGPLFTSPKRTELVDLDLIQPIQNKLLHDLVSTDQTHLKNIIACLFQALICYDPVGWGVPYNHVVITNTQEALMDVSLQLLCLLLDYRSQVGKVPFTKGAEYPEVKGQPIQNAFVSYVQSLDSPEDFAKIYGAICQKMENPLYANNTYLPYSKHGVGCHQELTLLMWHLMHVNQKFFAWLLETADITTFIYPLMHFVNEGRADSAQASFIHVAVYLLFVLSGNREFSVQLNKKFDKSPLTNIQGDSILNYGDWVISILSRVMVEGHEKLRSLREFCLLIICNTSYFIKGLSRTTAHKLVTIFCDFASPKLLFQNKHHPYYCHLLLETFNNYLQYQYSGNFFLFLSMIRARSHFRKVLRLVLLEDAPQDPTLPERPSTEAPAPPTPEQTQPVDTPDSEDKNKQHEQPPPPEISLQISKSITESILVSPKRWVPTQAWLTKWQEELPIKGILQFFNVVLPKIKPMMKKEANDEQVLYNFLVGFTLVGLLPPPQPITLRAFHPDPQNSKFFTEYLWGVLFLRNWTRSKMFDKLSIKLFHVGEAAK